MNDAPTEGPSCTAFIGDGLFAAGTPKDVALAIKRAATSGNDAVILVFDDQTGRQIDFDLSGSEEEVAERLRTTKDDVSPQRQSMGAPTRGRPKLGVVAREVTLLPRHWEWLAAQPEGASAVIRRLIDAARNQRSGVERARQAQAAADRFMMSMLGDQQGWEEASRSLYAGDGKRFQELTESWPVDLRNHARRLAAPAFMTSVENVRDSGT
ncbi:DUF2239 domain-containing protein (plasmid) [Azospirillum baldaniorum]|uniref:DUF2239 family protein n=1 Tax=Azospirillum baldaniorum TaxID=1064539 RepID=A0A9P1K150_9PROT|nr:DUF2239 family protein [Azospirillum baldaniorum]AWJ94589.1 DUF2239 domain-containing protein [Azospirillum baldaniorum]TWA70366.1 hypothetical protein FBZ85_12443 [Azospirillum brasilense]CCD03667.1 conserved hypothetical protein [Azospirillum baldaniorum]